MIILIQLVLQVLALAPLLTCMPDVMSRLEAVMDPARITRFTISSLANQLIGKSTSSSIIMLGWALQKGLIPLSIDAVETAIKLNGIAIDDNLAALKWGRLLAHDPNQLFACLGTSVIILTNIISHDKSRRYDRVFYCAIKIYQNNIYASAFQKNHC